jgi:hypothetical protein
MPEKHGVRDNTFAGARYARYPDFLTQLARAWRTTLSALSWRHWWTRAFGARTL